MIEGKGNGGVLLTIVHALIYIILLVSIVFGAISLLFLVMLLASLILLAIPVLLVMFANLSLAAQLAIIGLGVWTASELFLEGCKKSIGKLIGSLMPVGALIKGGAGYKVIAAAIGVEIYKSALEGC